MQNTYSVWTREKTLVSHSVSQEQLYRLRGLTDNGRAPYLDKQGRPEVAPALIVPHRKLRGVWLVAAGVSVEVIKAELRRNISKTPPLAADNYTVQKETFSNGKGAGWFYEFTGEDESGQQPWIESRWSPEAREQAA